MDTRRINVPLETMERATKQGRNKRYMVHIFFHEGGFLEDLFTTKREAVAYRSIIDDTVRKACLLDLANGRIVEWWKS